ncbi:unnamed protein product [Adineta ricciae]|uniref:Uncharacterized protein n=1 Tax=Adineta ricciae TaxID=249248 RepID=A0A815JFT5_ADIRI|nr:unnamed protein product [Adineta ricciae]CAF1412320.1 unnamed protein product [Adineta ricciae]
MGSRVSQVQEKIPISSLNTSYASKEESVQSIYAQIKQIVCDEKEDGRKESDQWEIIAAKLQSSAYKGREKEVFEKIDEQDSYALLHHAVLSNRLWICQKLINKYKCDVNLIGCDGQTPLHLSARSPEIKSNTDETTNTSTTSEDTIFHYLLKHPDIDIYIQDKQKRTALHYAIMRGRVGNVKALIEKYKSNKILEICDIQGALPIHYAFRFLSETTDLSQFNEPKSWFDKKTDGGKRPIDLAAEYGNLGIVQKYLCKDGQRDSDLMQAALRHSDKTVFDFLLRKETINAQTPERLLHSACRERHGHKSISCFSITNAQLQEQDGAGFTPLMVAVKNRRLECVIALLETGQCDEKVLNACSSNNRCTVLHICAEILHKEITDNLFQTLVKLKNYRDILVSQDISGDTPLHICAKTGNDHMCEKLLDLYSTLRRSNPGKIPMWCLANYNKLTAFQEAINNDQSRVVKKMLKFKCIPRSEKWTSMLCATDAQLSTNLHIAALHGNAKMVKELIRKNLDVNAFDMNDNTPLHNVVSSYNDDDKDIECRIKCVKYLIKNNADVNSYNIRRETPLHIASKYGSYRFVQVLLKYHADLLVTDIDGLNCLEVAIEEKNKEVVKYFIEHKRIFEMMRNAQIKSYGTEETIRNAIEENKDKAKEADAYTSNYKTIVENHPLFLMALHNKMKLMADPLSRSLADIKYKKFGRWIFWASFILYIAFISLFTILAERIDHPQQYYAETNTTFDTKSYRLYKINLYWIIAILLVKNLWIIAGFLWIYPKKILIFTFEIGALVLSIIFIFDAHYQEGVLMRCPTQWQYGVFGLFIGYLGLLYYIQYIHLIGIYAIMVKIIIVQFTFFLPVLSCFIVGFGIAFHMLFKYKEAFNNFSIRTLTEMVIMITGELNFSEVMFDENDSTKPYYKISFLMFLLFTIGMVILISNLLISLAVGEIVPLMNQAKGAQIDMYFELIADYEILRLQLYALFCKTLRTIILPDPYKLYQSCDMKKPPCRETITKKIIDFFTQTTYIEEKIFEAYEDEDKTDKQTKILFEIRNELKHPQQVNKTKTSTFNKKTVSPNSKKN